MTSLEKSQRSLGSSLSPSPGKLERTRYENDDDDDVDDDDDDDKRTAAPRAPLGAVLNGAPGTRSCDAPPWYADNARVYRETADCSLLRHDRACRGRARWLVAADSTAVAGAGSTEVMDNSGDVRALGLFDAVDNIERTSPTGRVENSEAEIYWQAEVVATFRLVEARIKRATCSRDASLPGFGARDPWNGELTASTPRTRANSHKYMHIYCTPYVLRFVSFFHSFTL